MKKFYYFFSISFFFLLFLNYGCNPTTGGFYPPSVIRGIVTDSATHRPLPGVEIHTIPTSPGAMSDTSGYYILSDIPMSSSGTSVWIVATRDHYFEKRVGLWVPANDSLVVNFSMLPSSGVYVYDNIQVFQLDNPQTLSAIDLNNFRTYPISYPIRDIDLIDSAGMKLRFKFMSSHKYEGYVGYGTYFGYSLGNFRKSDFDTLAMYYGAHDSLLPSDFPRFETDKFNIPLTEQSVYPFYLATRSQGLPNKIYGLLYIKSAEIEPLYGRFMVTVDVKINRNGKNYFLLYNQ